MKTTHPAIRRARRGPSAAGIGVLGVLVAALATPPAAADKTWTTYDRPAQYDSIATDTDVPIAMRDGVVLRADVRRPDAPGRFLPHITRLG